MTSIVFMGTPEFSATVLESLIQNDYQVLAVVTQPDRPVGRKHILTPSPAKKMAVAHGIEVLQPAKIGGSPEMQRVIDLAPDLIVTAAFGQFLPTKLLKAAKIAAVNVHGSLLPKYRGGAPIQYSILKGEKTTGITIIYMVKQMDAGDMLAQASLPITREDDTGTLFQRLAILGKDLLLKTLPKLIAGEITPVPQNEAEVTFAPNIQPAEEELDFNQSAQVVDQKVRALRPAPGAYTILAGVRTKIWAVEPTAVTTPAEPGTILSKTKHALVIATGENTAVSLETVQPAGKPRQSITDFLNGNQADLTVGQQVISK